MLFSSISFLYYFLPLIFIFYFLAPKSLKNSVLLVFSLIFYSWGEPKYIILMILSIFFGYLFGLLIEKHQNKKWKALLCGLSILLSLSFLLFFKYSNFFIQNLNLIIGSKISLLPLTLPIGISFYTFQIISYTVDVYRGEKAQKSIIDLATYISMFPQLIAGPIIRYSTIAEQLKERTHSLEKFSLGIRRFVLGLSKKVLIANQLGELCAAFRISDEKSILYYWLYAIAFMLHIYFDFSGYSDMAIGLGKLFGFDFSENFNYPYISRSITEFWRRWHISLGTWFRDYVYIPLGGNRSGKYRQLINIFIVWFLTGFWHGAAWNFMLWGLFFAFFLILEKLWLLKYLEKSKWLSSIYVLFLVCISFVMFNANSVREGLSDIAGLFGTGNIPLYSPESLYALRSFGFLILLAAFLATPLLAGWLKGFEKSIEETPKTTKLIPRVLPVLEPPLLMFLFLLVTAYLADGSFNPFLYFRF